MQNKKLTKLALITIILLTSTMIISSSITPASAQTQSTYGTELQGSWSAVQPATYSVPGGYSSYDWTNSAQGQNVTVENNASDTYGIATIVCQPGIYSVSVAGQTGPSQFLQNVYVSVVGTLKPKYIGLLSETNNNTWLRISDVELSTVGTRNNNFTQEVSWGDVGSINLASTTAPPAGSDSSPFITTLFDTAGILLGVLGLNPATTETVPVVGLFALLVSAFQFAYDITTSMQNTQNYVKPVEQTPGATGAYADWPGIQLGTNNYTQSCEASTEMQWYINGNDTTWTKQIQVQAAVTIQNCTQFLFGCPIWQNLITLNSSVYLTYDPHSAPQFTSTPPSTQTYELGISPADPQYLAWIVNDLSTNTDYTVTNETGLVMQGPTECYNGTVITFQIPPSDFTSGEANVYTYTCTLYDRGGNVVSSSAMVNVQYATCTDISITSPADGTSFYTTAGSMNVNFVVQISVSPYNPSSPFNQVQIEATGISQGDTNYPSTCVDATLVSAYTYSASLNLWSGNPANQYSVQATFNNEGGMNQGSDVRSEAIGVSVDQPPAPTIGNPYPSSITYTAGSTGTYTITWNPVSICPSTYQISYTDAQGDLHKLSSFPWGGGPITVTVPGGLYPGYYAWTCTVLDIFGRSASSSAAVTVLPQPPTISGPSSVTYGVGSTGNTITWTAFSNFPSYYVVTRNGVTVTNQTWSGGSITWGIDGLKVGTYTYTCTVCDTFGQRASSSVSVQVYPVPAVTCSSSTVSYVGSADPVYVTWTPSGSSPTTYTITGPKGTTSGSWTSGKGIQYDVGGLGGYSLHVVWKTYYFTFTAYNAYGESTSNTVTVKVEFNNSN